MKPAEDARRAHRVAQPVDWGIGRVNTWFLLDPRTPFGGARASGNIYIKL